MIRKILSIVVAFTFCLAAPTQPLELSSAKSPFTFKPDLRSVSHRRRQNALHNQSIPGQAVTLLPSGQFLVSGGEGSDGPVTTIWLRDPVSGTSTPLSGSLLFARSGHSSTLLPDGTVFIWGGVGESGSLVGAGEIFNPNTQQSQPLSNTGLLPRARHTATLLTDGSVLVAGGIGRGQEVTGSIQIWNPATGSLQSLSHEMRAPREGHVATLNADGTVAFWKGLDQNGLALNYGEVFDATTESSRFVVDPASLMPSSPQPFVEVSLPPDGATDVSPNTRLALRFSWPLRVDSVNSSTLVLSGPAGDIPALVVPAEAGMLAFVAPSAPLDGGTAYTLSISGCSDPSGRPLQQADITFTTAGTPSGAGVAGGGSSGSSGDGGSGPLDNKTFRLPPLQAPKGATALSGQVLKLNGAPLPHVLLQIDSQKAYTDETGRFLLENITPGHHPMVIDGSTANQAGREYGIYDDGVDVTAGQTTVLKYKIWMTPLDREHEVEIPSPTTTEFVVTTPRLPGLELHLPAGTVIKDRNGNVVTKLGITPIPVNHPPFPLPVGVEVPIYFTIQPGGAYIDMPTGTWAKGARLFYPNWRNARPGTPFDFWNYDPLQKGWYVYGEGEVDKTAESIVPDPGVEIYQFTGAMVGSSSARKGVGVCPGCPRDGEPVDLATGQFIYNKTDLALPDVIPLVFSRTYTQNDNLSRSFGIGAMSNYDIFIEGDFSSYSYLELQLPDGTLIYFYRTSPGASWSNAAFQHTSTGSEWYGATITYNSSVFPGAAWVLTRRDGMTYYFPDAYASANPAQMGIVGIKDRNGNTVFIKRDANSNLSSITSPNGRSISFTIDSQNRITQAKDNIGRTVSYSYDTPCGEGLLCQVTDVANGTWKYTYYPNTNNMQTIQDARGIVYLTNYYDVNNRVQKQVLADGVSTYQYSYTSTGGSQFPYYVGGGLPPGGTPTAVLQFRGCTTCSEGYSALESQTQVTDPNGNVHQVGFGPTGYPVTETFALGKPEQQTYNYSYFADNLLQSATDALNRVTSFNYDAMGNVLSVTRLSGTSNAVTTSFSYEANFNKLLSITDPLGHTTSFGYDSLSNLTSITDPLGNKTVLTNDSEGRPLTVTDPLQNTASFTYSSGDLASLTDPLNRTATGFTDGAGRPLSVTDPSGRTTRLAYNALNQVTTITDPMGNQTSFGYDPNGNLLSVTDANQHQTQYTYDNFDRVQTRKDALGNQECYGTFSGSVCQANGYDGNDNLLQYTDRRGKVAVFTYDGLERLKFAGYGMTAGPAYESTVNYSYDGGNRLTQVVDSITGTVTPGFDLLDRETSETTPQGSVSYTYDNADRRQTMTVAGQTAANYTFDNADRLTQIAQGSSAVSLAYDLTNRRTFLTLPNGVSANYTYDAASDLTGLTYMNGSTTLGNLAYTYDLLGRRVNAGGTFAQANLPNTVTTTAYNANNQLTTWGTANLFYDANGNMTSDGTHSYTWDARNRLTQMDLGNTASFSYDPSGRRVSKSILGTSTSFLYDGANPIQEVIGGTNTANSLSGGIDEVFQRTDSSGARGFLTDAQGNTLALADSTGTLQTQYTFEPFGNTAATGTATTNSFAYTGRELDPTGLYFYRARYYNPGLGRFISEDPLGFAGSGTNFYSYASDDPINLVDPFGLYDGWDFLHDAGSFSEGAADALTFGVVSKINNHYGANVAVNRCGWVHGAGTIVGTALSTAIGGAIGAEAAEVNAGKKGFEFSHWIPGRYFRWFKSETGINVGNGRSIVNGNFVSSMEHYLTDPFRYPAGWRAWGAKLNPVFQQLRRIPYIYDGMAAGAAYGTAGALAGRSCGCS